MNFILLVKLNGAYTPSVSIPRHSQYPPQASHIILQKTAAHVPFREENSQNDQHIPSGQVNLTEVLF